METFQFIVIKKSVCVKLFLHSTAGTLGLPTGVTGVEQSQANGRAEQRVRALRERLPIIIEDARRRGVEIILGHPVAQWARSDVDLSDGGTKKNHAS